MEGDGSLRFRAETVLRHKERLENLRDARARNRLEARKIYKDKLKLKKDFIRPEDLVRDYRRKQLNYADYKLRKNKKAALESGAGEVVFVVRVQGSKNLTNQQKSILNKLGLRKIHEGHFFLNTEELKTKLKCVENQIVFGALTFASAKELVNKRAFFIKGDEVAPLTSNKPVEDHLGSHGLVCIEDLVAELVKGGKKFEQVKKFLCSFKLNKPSGGYGDKKRSVRQGGVWGFYPDGLNDLLAQMI